MCLSREEQDSMHTLAGTVEETVELSQSIYRAVIHAADSVHVGSSLSVSPDEMPTEIALKLAPLPVFDESKD